MIHTSFFCVVNLKSGNLAICPGKFPVKQNYSGYEVAAIPTNEYLSGIRISG
jgi:hypothetical protein